MDAAFYVDPVQHSLSTATHFHSNSQFIDNEHILFTSRKILQQSKNLRTQGSIDDADALLLTVLASAACIGALVLLFFSIRSCYRCWKRRARFQNGVSENSSINADQGGPFCDDDKFSEGYSNRYASDRNLAMCAQLYHYEKQKRQLLALERAAAQSETETSQTSPPSYHASLFTCRRPSRDLHSNAPLCSPTDQNWLLTVDGDQSVQAITNDEEEYAIYEYPGLVNTVGNVEIDNPLYQTPNVTHCERTETNDSEAKNTPATQPASATTDSCVFLSSTPLSAAPKQQDSLTNTD